MAKRHSNKVGNLESLFLRLEELVLANSGEDEFEEVFKLVIAKLWAEQSGNAGRFQPGENETDTYQRVLSLLREADKAWPGILDPLEPALTPEHLQVCVSALAPHSIAEAGLEVMDGFFEFLVSKGAKGAKGQYFTPRHVVELCVRMLKPGVDETVLDPACGSGGFLVSTLNYVRESGGLTSGAALTKYCSSKIWGFDLDSRATRVAKALMVVVGDGSANIIRLNSLLRPEMGDLFTNDSGDGGSVLTIEDVCRSRMRRHKGFDIILTNPPFAGEVRERSVLEEYTLGRGRSRIERDVLFLERCVDLLRPGGRLAIVLPHNKFAANTWAYARRWLVQKARVLAVVGLGRNTFLPHTHQKASVLFLQRRRSGEQPRPEQPVFFAISERDGKNSKGQPVLRTGAKETDAAWLRMDHDLGEVELAFDDFCKSEGLAIGAHS